ncbi:uncharacterized protein B0I36DRAFT_319127 [Microdochium trichocladiopsis]|uniref:DUF7708 domain-containing protein n=1 Tax=Microdochium trichocladiopsis TaxID=1682393 RepID=A0A9P9BTT9_9PEZI|nr:uncharacterized protein B0I36DRAFT_319127 [Microdochium trichocladiopsis]KAH7035822.1 hypothetical protein B0I36DRAFT_319127 [Microdochium trichocladiopsis]
MSLSSGTCSVAKDAFTSAKKVFLTHTLPSSGSLTAVEDSATIEDLQDAIRQSLSLYEARVASSGKTRKWLQKASEGICHYGTILDVFVQHHPEYVALVWGAMKFLFISVQNHGQTLKILAKSIAKVAQHLPNIQRLSALYPSNEMKVAVETLYSHLLDFLLKAHRWLTESRLKHFYHSLTQPPELVYGDVLDNISQATARITELASVESQTEIRNMHDDHSRDLKEIASTVKAAEVARKNDIQLLERSVSRLHVSQTHQSAQLTRIVMMLAGTDSTIHDVVTKVENFHAIQTSAVLNTNLHLTQLEQLHVLSNMSLSFEDPDKCLQRHSSLRRRRGKANGGKPVVNNIWLSPKLRRAAGSPSSTITTVRGPFSTRWAIQDFGVDLIQAISSPSSAARVLWALTDAANDSRSRETVWNTANLMKVLTWQALRVVAANTNTAYTAREALPTEKDMSMRYSRFYTTRAEQDWVTFFAEVVSKLEQKQVFVVIDLAAVESCWRDGDAGRRDGQQFDLIRALGQLTREITRPILKIVLLVYDATWSGHVFETAAGSIVQVRMEKARPITMLSRGMPQGKVRRVLGAR